MRYAITLTFLGIVMSAIGSQQGVIAIPLCWLGFNFVLLGTAHASKNHQIFGKRPDGTLPCWSWIVFCPLFILNFAVWQLFRALSSEPAINRITSDITIGRRLQASEHLGQFSNHVDLAAEFQEPEIFRRSKGYFSFPILDASSPTPDQLDEAIKRLSPGPTFIHCAQGHGRTGLFTLALLLHTRAVPTVSDGMKLLASFRPGVRLNADQRNCITLYSAKIKLSASITPHQDPPP
jgi:protein-tyrosine phosphatase